MCLLHGAVVWSTVCDLCYFLIILGYIFLRLRPGPEVIKLFSLDSTEHEISFAHINLNAEK